MTQAISAPAVTSFAAELAELLIETESAQTDATTEQRDAARADFLTEAQHQIEALHQAANDALDGAWASAAFSVAGAACDVIGSVENYDAGVAKSKLCIGSTTPEVAKDTELAGTFTTIGKALADFAAPAKTFVGDAPAADANANAKYFETLAEKAKWLIGDASTELDKVDKLGSKVLDLLQGIDQDQNSATNAVIGRI